MGTEKRIVCREAKGVQLVQLQKGDAETLVHFMNDPEVTQYLSLRKPISLKEEREWVDKITQGADDSFTFGLMVADKLIGTMTLGSIDWISRFATTGASIGNKDYWGQGYGTSAKMLLLDFAFNDLELRIIYSKVLETNGRSEAYALKCGYQQVGVLPEKHLRNGRRVDELQMQVTRETWLPQYRKWQNDNL